MCVSDKHLKGLGLREDMCKLPPASAASGFVEPVAFDVEEPFVTEVPGSFIATPLGQRNLGLGLLKNSI